MVIIGNEGALVVGGARRGRRGVGAAGRAAVRGPGRDGGCRHDRGRPWIALSGALRQYRGVNETISSLLLTYIAIALINHLVEGPLRDPTSLNKPSTCPIGDANMIGTIPGTDVHWGLAFGIVAAVLCLRADLSHLWLRRAGDRRQRPRAQGVGLDVGRYV